MNSLFIFYFLYFCCVLCVCDAHMSGTAWEDQRTNPGPSSPLWPLGTQLRSSDLHSKHLPEQVLQVCCMAV